MPSRPNLKRPGYTATGRQWQTIEALRSDGWVIVDRGQAEEMALQVKRAANLLYNVGHRQDVSDDDRAAMRASVEPLDSVTKLLGGNPMSVAIAVGPEGTG